MCCNVFTWTDYCVFAIMLGISALIGIFHARNGQKTAEEILMGNKSMGTLPVAISMMASFLSAITLIGYPSEIYQYGTQYIFTFVFVQPIVILLASYFFVPVFYELGLTSSYQYLEGRFDGTVRTFCCIVYCINYLFYMGVVLYAPALTLSAVTGINKWISVVATGIVCTFYTTIGGMKAVVWSDVFQTVVMFGSLLLIVVMGLIENGGIWQVFRENQEAGRLEFFNLDIGPYVRHTFPSTFVGITIMSITAYGTNQAMIQRYLSVPTLRAAKMSLWSVLPMKVILVSTVGFVGLLTFAKYRHCDPFAVKQLSNPDQILPFFVMQILGSIPGCPGLFVAGVFSGTLSTLSSGINAMSAVLYEDFIKVYLKPNLSKSQVTKLLKLLSIILGGIALASTILASQLGTIIQATNTITSLTGSPIFAIFLLGMFFPLANSKGTLLGALFGISINLWLGIGNLVSKPYYPTKRIYVDECVDLYQNITRLTYNETTFGLPNQLLLSKNEDIMPLYQISYFYFSLIGTVSTLLFGLLFSVMFRHLGFPAEKQVDKRMFVPIIRNRLEQKQRDKYNTFSQSSISSTLSENQRSFSHYDQHTVNNDDDNKIGKINNYKNNSKNVSKNEMITKF